MALWFCHALPLHAKVGDRSVDFTCRPILRGFVQYSSIATYRRHGVGQVLSILHLNRKVRFSLMRFPKASSFHSDKSGVASSTYPHLCDH